MNHFQLNYLERLQHWSELRKNTENLNLQDKCVKIDEWWQKAPLVNHYLHPFDLDDWPNPWELLNENTYCKVARGLGICYTLKLVGVNDFEFHEAKDEYSEEVYIVSVDYGKYILNYHPGSVLNIHLTNFTIQKSIDVTKVLKKLG